MPDSVCSLRALTKYAPIRYVPVRFSLSSGDDTTVVDIVRCGNRFNDDTLAESSGECSNWPRPGFTWIDSHSLVLIAEIHAVIRSLAFHDRRIGTIAHRFPSATSAPPSDAPQTCRSAPRSGLGSRSHRCPRASASCTHCAGAADSFTAQF